MVSVLIDRQLSWLRVREVSSSPTRRSAGWLLLVSSPPFQVDTCAQQHKLVLPSLSGFLNYPDVQEIFWVACLLDSGAGKKEGYLLLLPTYLPNPSPSYLLFCISPVSLFPSPFLLLLLPPPPPSSSFTILFLLHPSSGLPFPTFLFYLSSYSLKFDGLVFSPPPPHVFLSYVFQLSYLLSPSTAYLSHLLFSSICLPP